MKTVRLFSLKTLTFMWKVKEVVYKSMYLLQLQENPLNSLSATTAADKILK